MTVFLNDIPKQQCLGKEPYKSFLKSFGMMPQNAEAYEISLNIGMGKDGFFNGFYRDRNYMKNPVIKFIFGTGNGDGSKEYFVRMSYRFDCTDNNFSFYRKHIMLLKMRSGYFYIPNATNFEFSSRIDEQFELNFDVITDDHAKLKEICLSLINTIISVFSFED